MHGYCSFSWCISAQLIFLSRIFHIASKCQCIRVHWTLLCMTAAFVYLQMRFQKKSSSQLAMFHIESLDSIRLRALRCYIFEWHECWPLEMCDMPFSTGDKYALTVWDVNKKSRWNVRLLWVHSLFCCYIYIVLCVMTGCCVQHFVLVIVEWIGVVWHFLDDDWASIQRSGHITFSHNLFFNFRWNNHNHWIYVVLCGDSFDYSHNYVMLVIYLFEENSYISAAKFKQTLTIFHQFTIYIPINQLHSLAVSMVLNSRHSNKANEKKRLYHKKNNNNNDDNNYTRRPSHRSNRKRERENDERDVKIDC